MHRSIRVASLAVASIVVGMTHEALAQTCTNNSNGTNCSSYTQSGTGGAGVLGIQSGGGGVGVEGQDTSTSSPYGYGVEGTTNYGIGVYGHASGSDATAVEGEYYGTGSTGSGVYGYAPNAGYGVYADGYGYGVYSTSSNGYAGYFTSPGTGTMFTDATLYGNASASGGTGVLGTGYGYGVVGNSASSGYGVYGNNTGSGKGVYGTAVAGYGVYGNDSSSGYGVYGVSSTGIGISGSGSTGVYGTGTGQGLEGYGHGTSAVGIYGTCSGTSCLAGFFYGPVTVDGEITVSSCSGCASDIRLKRDVRPLDGALGRLLQLKGVTFEWNDPAAHKNEAGHGDGRQTGFIAQEVEKVFPNFVKEDGYTAPDGQKYKTLELRQIEALEVESIRELNAQNDDLRAKLEANQARTAKLEDRLDALQNGRDPITGSVGVGRGTLLFVGLGLAGAFGISRRKRAEKKA